MLDRKYERQMSGKEKRKFEAEKMSQMTKGETGVSVDVL